MVGEFPSSRPTALYPPPTKGSPNAAETKLDAALLDFLLSLYVSSVSWPVVYAYDKVVPTTPRYAETGLAYTPGAVSKAPWRGGYGVVKRGGR